MRRGQAMVESVLAVIFVTFVLFFSIYIARMLTAKILVDHAAARAARARAVGLNDFMCVKSARVAMIPVAGRSILPEAEISTAAELGRIPIYLASEHPARARAILDYEWWGNSSLSMAETHGIVPTIDAETSLATDTFSVNGSASIESHYPLYMNEF